MRPEPYRYHDGATLIAEITDEGIVSLVLGGSMTREHHAAVVAWAEKVKEVLHFMKAKDPDRVLTLVDVSTLEHYDTDAIEVCRELMAGNRGLATKTAIYGASTIVRVTIELMIGITRRYSMKLFAGRDEAYAWLVDDTQRPEIAEEHTAP